MMQVPRSAVGDTDRFSEPFRPVELFDRGKEGIHIHQRDHSGPGFVFYRNAVHTYSIIQ